MGWKWGAADRVRDHRPAITIVVILIYIAVCIGTVVYYRRERPEQFNRWLHGRLPGARRGVFLSPLYYQYTPLPPTRCVRELGRDRLAARWASS